MNYLFMPRLYGNKTIDVAKRVAKAGWVRRRRKGRVIYTHPNCASVRCLVDALRETQRMMKQRVSTASTVVTDDMTFFHAAP